MSTRVFGGPALTGMGLICGLLLLAGCAGQPVSRYQQAHDSEPRHNRDLTKVPDAQPRIEAPSRGGNKSPYRVFGKQYWVMPTSIGYRATGTASWYGTKFHGHLTSNGETYDMYGMSAAHKTLPLPTYVRVTNLRNNRQVIVRINDRGPFHDDRLIDLSYAAATKLGFAQKGTAPVRIEAIDPLAWQRSKGGMPAAQSDRQTASPGATDQLYLQVGAFASLESARRLKQRLQQVTSEPVTVSLDQVHTPGLHKVQVGPLPGRQRAEQLRQAISRNGLGKALLVAQP